MKWLFFGLGLMAGGMLGVAFMYLCAERQSGQDQGTNERRQSCA